jgi:hypothetical protein
MTSPKVSQQLGSHCFRSACFSWERNCRETAHTPATQESGVRAAYFILALSRDWGGKTCLASGHHCFHCPATLIRPKSAFALRSEFR